MSKLQGLPWNSQENLKRTKSTTVIHVHHVAPTTSPWKRVKKNYDKVSLLSEPMYSLHKHFIELPSMPLQQHVLIQIRVLIQFHTLCILSTNLTCLGKILQRCLDVQF